jgi:CBS domain-containing protein
VEVARKLDQQEADMAVFVREIMNEELYAVGLGDTVAEAVGAIVALQINAAPVLDADRRPRGMVTLRELLDAPPTRRAAECATPEFASIQPVDSLADAARRMADTGQQQLVVVDVDGRAIGIVSAFDLVRAMIGAPITHPRAFPHFDSGAGVNWSDDATLEARNVLQVPEAAGVIALVLGGAGATEQVMWAETCSNLRQRLGKILGGPRHEVPGLARALATGRLRFRVAMVPDFSERERVLTVVLGRAMAELRPAVAGRA